MMLVRLTSSLYSFSHNILLFFLSSNLKVTISSLETLAAGSPKNQKIGPYADRPYVNNFPLYFVDFIVP